jgi:protein TonB
MQLRQSPPDALVSISDYILERFGLVATMQVALLASLAFHAAAIVGLGFKVPDPRQWDAPHNVLDVVLVNAKSQAKPLKADALAQANLDGGGNTDEKRRASTPFPNIDKSQPSPDLRQAQTRVQQLEQEAKELMTRLKSKSAVAPADPVSDKGEKADPTAQDLIEKSLEIQRLEAQIRREFQAYQERPRKTFFCCAKSGTLSSRGDEAYPACLGASDYARAGRRGMRRPGCHSVASIPSLPCAPVAPGVPHPGRWARRHAG